jgi:hypothetical protein
MQYSEGTLLSTTSEGGWIWDIVSDAASREHFYERHLKGGRMWDIVSDAVEREYFYV